MTAFSLAIEVAGAVGCTIILWTIVVTARKYSALPARVAYPKNYGDDEDMVLPKLVIWFAPAFQAAIACVVAWAISLGPSHTHGDPLTGLIVTDVVLLLLLIVQSTVILRPNEA